MASPGVGLIAVFESFIGDISTLGTGIDTKPLPYKQHHRARNNVENSVMLPKKNTKQSSQRQKVETTASLQKIFALSRTLSSPGAATAHTTIPWLLNPFRERGLDSRQGQDNSRKRGGKSA